MKMQKSFAEHIEKLCETTSAALEECGFEELIICAGDQPYYFADDREISFTPTPHFQHWCPVGSPSHLLQFRPGEKPRLVYYYPSDFWYEQTPVGDPYWSSSFEICEISDRTKLTQALRTPKRAVVIGPEMTLPDIETNQITWNPDPLLKQLDWFRSFKSKYEVDCIDGAQAASVVPHRAAMDCFLGGGSEYDIYFEFLKATGLQERELPYISIVGLNEKSAILHYQQKRTSGSGDILLIDAGTRFERFGSDITRTYALQSAPEVFRTLLSGMQALQLELCRLVAPGVSIADLHAKAHELIFLLLCEVGIIKGLSKESSSEQTLSTSFFPHGLGHLLGIQVHDVGGHQIDRHGATRPPPARFPKLRSTRDLQPGMVLTIEPGLYFIPILLDRLRSDTLAKHINWPVVDKLVPFGGIRIEDDVLVTSSGHDNLTRRHVI